MNFAGLIKHPGAAAALALGVSTSAEEPRDTLRAPNARFNFRCITPD